MSASPGDAPLAVQPAAVFRAALADVVGRERNTRSRRPERVAALQTLSAADQAALGEQFEAALRGSRDTAALAAQLHEALRALCPETTVDEEEESDA